MIETENPVSAERIATIRAFVAERLFRQPKDVHLHSRLIADLGADSLDFVDFHFQLEKRFGIRFEPGEFFDFSGNLVTKDGFLKREAVERLIDWVPALKSRPDRDHVPWGEVLNLLTVETLLGIVEKKLAATQGAR
jgi:acyl carrier protein